MTKIVQLITRTLFIALVVMPLTLKADEAGVLKKYETVSAALVKDDLEAAKKAAAELATEAKAAGQEAMASEAGKLVGSDSLENARAHFKPISAEAVKLAEGREGWYIATCPMAHADWVQSEKEIANPFMGQSMPKCGALKKPKL